MVYCIPISLFIYRTILKSLEITRTIVAKGQRAVYYKNSRTNSFGGLVISLVFLDN
jgi:hypothetical protein